ncbi:chitobiase/beta-hexosaminidase C-terminal domain-containing protein [Clostridium sp. AL.422]|uniref:chitobiase/beta-hexosaminidase C-terminal domain-containing protein n=1 Tax=Clostridium TaxID=1485 RepID=UPI00293DD8DB|nr:MULTISPECIES: chitobiase/beta-hexosaminidase C-terminal domain-containing protein [unclassified Clostridium]MDV4150719.1 chitobiase/beta-hexosaminidase C-terminal domain-containing protein [Clostridium sp. AL.422]
MLKMDLTSKNLNTPTIVNIYNFIRKTVYPSGEFVEDDLKTVLYQLEILKQYGLPATYALKYDALMDKRYSELIKEYVDDYDEVGVWWEVDKQLAEKAGVKWKGKTPVDDHVNIGYSLGYSKEDRLKMVDVYMEDFKSIFGYYPKSVGSWVIDIITLTYFKEKYNVEAAALCRDQIGTDGFTLWGGYYNQGYYPSVLNEYIPSQSKEMQLDLPIFRMLGPDPIYAFEDGLRESVNGVHTLEPACVIGQTKEWVEWLFDRCINEPVLGFSYIQTGQENTFLWNTMRKGYELQIPYISQLTKIGKLRVETLKESGEWFKKKYFLTPPTTITASKDWNKENLRASWYNSRFYRMSLLWENNLLSIRDLHLFNENYKSRYYEDTLKDNESIFDSLPILNAHYWSDKDLRASIDFVKIDSNEKINKVSGEEPKFSIINESSYEVSWKINEGSEMNIICKESEIVFKESSYKDDKKKLALSFNRIPVVRNVYKKELVCMHNGFKYSLYLSKGEFILNENSKLLIVSEENEISIITSKNEDVIKEEFYSKEYLLNADEIDNYIPKYQKLKSKSKILPRAMKPEIFPKNIVLEEPINQEFIIYNPNKTGEVRYTLDGSEPNRESDSYSNPITINDNTTIKAKAFISGFKESEVEEVSLYKSIKIKDIKTFTSPVEIKKYNKNGVYDLIDGLKGSKDYTDGCWLGYHDDLDVIIDLGEEKNISKVTVGFLQDTRAWIYYPKFIDFKYSLDGKEFNESEIIYHKNSTPRKEVAVENISSKYKGDKKIRYIRIFAKNEEVCPSWSITAGEGPAFMFVDEIIVE